MSNNLPDESKIFVPHKLNDFEKLLFAQRVIKDLQAENKRLLLDNEELKRSLKTFDELFTSSEPEKKQFRADKFYKNIQHRLLEMSAKKRKYKIECERLKHENAMLRIKIGFLK